MIQEETHLRDNYLLNVSGCVQYWKNLRLGSPLDRDFPAVYSVLLKYADLIYFDGAKLHIVEFKINDVIKGIGQLLVYKNLVPKTEVLKHLADYPAVLHLVATYSDDDVVECCRQLGILYEVFNY